MALVKLRARLANGTSRVMTDADRRTNQQAIAVARDQAQLPAFVATGTTRWQAIRRAYEQVASALVATGQSEDRRLAGDVRQFLSEHPDLKTTPEMFAARHARNLSAKPPGSEVPPPELTPGDPGRRR